MSCWLTNYNLSTNTLNRHQHFIDLISWPLNSNKETLTLLLVTSSVYMETETFIYYLQGEGLMYSPVFMVTVLLGYLPFALLIILGLRCYVSARYRRRWKTTSYYKIYPVQMCVLLIATIFHDTPEMILLYFFYTRYKPPSFDLRMTALIQPFIAVAVAAVGIGMLPFIITPSSGKLPLAIAKNNRHQKW